MYRPSFNPNCRPHYRRNSNFVPRGRGNWNGQRPYYGHLYPAQNNHEENWCETCDRAFPNIAMLDQHLQQHQKCNIDGCQFIAHPKVITKHIQMQHSTGLFKKIANLNNPEEIQRWRDERKKKYPTKENVERKVAEIKEKIERGEKMGLRQSKDNRNKKHGEQHKRKYPFGDENFDKGKKHAKPNNFSNKKIQPKKEKTIPNMDNNRKLKPFAGIQDMIDENETDFHEQEKCDYIIEDDEETLQKPVQETTLKAEEPSVCGALSTLMCVYGSSDEEPEQHQTAVKTNTVKLSISANQQKRNKVQNFDNKPPDNIKQNNEEETKEDLEDDSGPEEVHTDKKLEVQIKNVPISRDKWKKNKQFNNPRKPAQIKPKTKIPSTLLYKLLHREIQQERNIILQCIRHIVKNNYFDK